MASGSRSSSALSTESVTESIDKSEKEESHETSGESRAESESISLLDRLRSPTASDLARKGEFTAIHPLENEGLVKHNMMSRGIIGIKIKHKLIWY